MEVNDFVTIKAEPPDSINRRARVVKVTMKGVVVSNMNMPFQGTFARKFFNFNEVEK